MKHLGDITKINGSEIVSVDCITFGSPCQDLSIAGKRKGLDGERSGLFGEAVRIITEMREEEINRGRTDEYIRPRYAIWENVPGAFSSNKGEDFRTVLEMLARIKEPEAIIPKLDGKQKWTKSGCIIANGWSIAWRLMDAQFWGVPQRRKRIALVADFAGQSAPEILFEQTSLRGDFEESKGTGERTSRDSGKSIDECYTLKIRSGCDGGGKGPLIQNNKSATLATHNDQTLFSYGISSKNSNAMKSSNPHSGIYEADTSRTLDINGGNPTCNQGEIIIAQKAYDKWKHDDKSATLKASGGSYGGSENLVISVEQSSREITKE